MPWRQSIAAADTMRESPDPPTVPLVGAASPSRQDTQRRGGSSPSSHSGLPGRGLARGDFRPLALNGWGDGYNSYAHSMAWFRDRLYVGVARANFQLATTREHGYPWPVYPVRCPENLLDLDTRARIRRWDPRDGSWEEIHTASMMVGIGGVRIPTEIGFRGMTVFQGPTDDAPALYVGAYSGLAKHRDPAREQGPRIYRSIDGRSFEPVSAPGLGRKGMSGFRSLVPYKGRLYTSPIGTATKVPNVSLYPVVLESVDPARGEWRPASLPGFGSAENVAVFEMAEFNGSLYAATGNVASGFELWRTDARGEPPYAWKQVLRLGAYRGNLSEAAPSMCVFGDALYVGTAVQDGGYDREHRVGPSPAEILRVFPDDTWEIVVGSARLTPEGLRVPASGLRPGFDNFFNGYIWRLCVHDGWLYAGTFDWSTYLRWFDRDRWPEALREAVERIGIEETIAKEGGCDLMRTRDGERWYCTTRTGFDNPCNSGIRTMVSTPHGLAVGTVNPFGPEIAVRRDGAWRYEANDRGGLEIWLGSPREGAAPADTEADAIVGYGMERADGGGETPVRRRVARMSPAEFEFDDERLRDLGRRIDVRSVRPDLVSLVCSLQHLSVEGVENLPRSGGYLIASNHVGSPVLAGPSLTAEDALLLAHVILRETGRPARFMADLGFWDTDLARRLCEETCAKLGFVPITVGNGVRLLRMGSIVVVYPEGRYSSPDYRLRPFFWGFAKMAREAGAPVVPAFLIGPHESRQRIEVGGRIVFLNAYAPAPADYKIVFLPPLDVRQHVPDHLDREALRAFCEMVRGRIQTALDREGEERGIFPQLRGLQETHTASRHGSDPAPDGARRKPS